MDTSVKKLARCAIYTRKSTEHNLDLEFNSLDAQREACAAYIKSQAHEGWRLIRDRYDDGAFSGASLERPALQNLLADVWTGKIDVIVVCRGIPLWDLLRKHSRPTDLIKNLRNENGLADTRQSRSRRGFSRTLVLAVRNRSACGH